MTPPVTPAGLSPAATVAPAAPSPPGAPGAPGGPPPADPDIAEAARGFEGIFMSMLIDEMMSGTAIGSANPMYAGLVTEKLGDALADAGGIGLAAVLERQLGGAR